MSRWTFSDIKRKVRRLTGRQSESELSETLLSDYVNKYYVYDFAKEVMPIELKTWFEFTLTIDVAEYTLDSLNFNDNYLSINNPIILSTYNIALYTSPEIFSIKYPEIENPQSGFPEAVLLYNNKLTFSCPPSADYLDFKAAAVIRPDELVNDTDLPISEDFGSVIAYGTSIEILEDNGELESLQLISSMYEKHKLTLMRKFHMQNINQRAYPTF